MKTEAHEEHELPEHHSGLLSDLDNELRVSDEADAHELVLAVIDVLLQRGYCNRCGDKMSNNGYCCWNCYESRGYPDD